MFGDGRTHHAMCRHGCELGWGNVAAWIMRDAVAEKNWWRLRQSGIRGWMSWLAVGS